MYRQVCTRIRVGVWGTSQAPTPVADRANSSIRLGSYFGRRCHAARHSIGGALPSSSPPGATISRLGQHQSLGVTASRLYPTELRRNA